MDSDPDEGDFEDLYHRAPCGYLSMTLDGIILQVNDTLLDWTGYRREDLIGRVFVDLLQPGSQLLLETRFLSVLHLHGAADEVSMSLRTADGVAVPALFNGVVVTDGDGQSRSIRTAVFPARQRHDYERELLATLRRAEASEARIGLLQGAAGAFSAAVTETELADQLASVVRQGFSTPTVAVYLDGPAGSLTRASGVALLEEVVRSGELDGLLVGAPSGHARPHGSRRRVGTSRADGRRPGGDDLRGAAVGRTCSARGARQRIRPVARAR